MTNIILATDSYKLNHWNQYPRDTEAVYSYLESREGATWPYTVFFGLQYALREYLEGQVVTWDMLKEAGDVAHRHFGRNDLFNYKGWAHVLEEHGGRLPLRIKAVPEGTSVPTGNVLMTVENTDPACFWLTNAVESLLTHVWYPSTVATLSRTTKELIKQFLDETADNAEGLPFMLHDFGYRGASSHESATIGGAAHLVNFLGTDTVPAMELLQEYYAPGDGPIGLSVPATEHSVMTARGEGGEIDVVAQLLDEYPTGILSVVADSYNIYKFVHAIGGGFKDQILTRDGTFVVRPDSVTTRHDTPGELTAWILDQLWFYFRGETNSKGYQVLDPHVRVLWGDGIDPAGIQEILSCAAREGFSAENLVFGMGGGLLQRVNRDTQRFAFKASAIKRSGEWHDIFKQPLDTSKISKRGRLQLTRFTDYLGDDRYETMEEGTRVGHTLDLRDPDHRAEVQDVLETVFEDGRIVKSYTLDEVRENARCDTM